MSVTTLRRVLSRSMVRCADRAVPAVALSLIALLLVCLHWVHQGAMIAQNDLSPGYNVQNVLEATFSGWNHFSNYFGQLDPGVAFWPLYAEVWLLQALFGPSVAQGLELWSLLAAGWLGTYFCARTMNATPRAGVLAAWVYTLNPLTLVGITFVTGTWLQALFPWVIGLISDAVHYEHRRPRVAFVLVAISFSVLSPLGGTPQILFTFVLGGVAWTVYLLLVACRDLSGFLAWAGRTAIYMVLASLWWFVPVAASYLGATLTRTTSASVQSWVFQRASFLNLLRLNGVWTWGHSIYYPFARAYDANVILYASGFVLVVATAFGLIYGSNSTRRYVRFAFSVALMAFFLAKGMHPPLVWLNKLVYRLPGMFLLLESGGALIIGLFGLSLAAAFLTDDLIAGAGARVGYVKSYAAYVAIGVLSAISAFPLISGAVFHGPVEGMPSMYIRVPAYWQSVADRLNAESSGAPGGVLLLPADNFYQSNYRWGYRGADLLPQALINRRVLLPGVTVTGYIAHASSSSLYDDIQRLVATRSRLLPKVLRDLGIRFVLYRGDVTDHGVPTIRPASLAALLHVRPEHFGPITLFDLGLAAPWVTANRKFVVDRFWSLSPASVEELRNMSSRLPRIRLADVPLDMLPNAVGLEYQALPLSLDYALPAPIRRLPKGVVFTSDARHQEMRMPSLGRGRLAASFSAGPRVPSDRTTIEGVLARSTRRQTVSDLVPLAIGLPPLAQSDGKSIIQVYQPLSRAEHFTVMIGVRRGSGAYELTGARGHVYKATITNGRETASACFRNVLIPAGDSLLTLTRTEKAPVVTGILKGAGEPLIGTVQIVTPRPLASASILHTYRTLALPNVPLAARPMIRLATYSPLPSVPFHVIIVAKSGHRHLVLPVNVYSGKTLAISKLLTMNYASSDLQSLIKDKRSMTLLRVLVDAGPAKKFLFWKSSIFGAVTWDTMPGRMRVRIGRTTLTEPGSPGNVAMQAFDSSNTRLRFGALPYTLQVGVLGNSLPPAHPTALRKLLVRDGFVTASVPRSFIGVVSTRDVFSSTWFGVRLFPHPALLRHIYVDEWKNGWLLQGGGRIALVNIVVVFEWLALVCCGAFVLALGLRARKT